MDRRRFLATLGIGAGAAAFARSFDAFAAPVDPWLADFHAARKAKPWLAGWEDAAFESLPRRALSVRGTLPRGLTGALYRTGPGRMERAGMRYHHWFDGDGLMHAWRIGERGVTHEAQMIATSKYTREKAKGRFLVDAAGTQIPDGMPIRNNDDLNTANTAVVAHNDRLYALWEGGSAWELDPETLASRGAKTWRDDLEHLPFSAHPLLDKDGSLWNFGLVSYADPPQMLVWRVGPDGAMRDFSTRKLSFPGYLHSFGMTERHLLFVLNPWVWTPTAGSAFFDAMQWQPGLGSRLIVVDKAKLDQVREFELPAGMAYHWADAYEHDGAIELFGCWYDDASALDASLATIMRGGAAGGGAASTLVRVRADLRNGRASMERLPRTNVEFPVWDSRAERAGRLYMPMQQHDNAAGWTDSVGAIDRRRERTDAYYFGDHYLVEEHRFVAKPGSLRVGEGWLVGTALDWKAQQTCMTVFDAGNLAAGPLCEARLPQTVPLGFHGCFASQSRSS